MNVSQKTYLSKKATELKPSGIRRFFDLLQVWKVLYLLVWESLILSQLGVLREAAINSLEQGFTSYTANAGLLRAYVRNFQISKKKFNVEYSAEKEMIVTVGASQAIDIAMRAILDPGDEVIIIEPCFVSYLPMVELAGGVAVQVQTLKENDFKISPRQLEAVITEKTKAIMLCSPNNPTGSMLNKKELTELAEIVEKHDLLVIADEIYGELVYDEEYTSLPTIPGMKERTILVSGFSKTFAMTGWRLGFVCAHS